MPATPRPTTGPTSFASALWLCLATAVLLTLTFPPAYAWPLAFFAIVPFGVCVIGRPLKWKWLGLYWLLGFVYFSLNLFWLWPVTVAGTLVLSLYLAVYFVLFAFGLRRLVVDLRVPATFALPLVWTAVEFCRGTFLEGGFPWFTVGTSFAGHAWFLSGVSARFLQIADLFGVWGLTFLAMSVNGFCLDLLRLPLIRPKDKKVNPALINLGIYTGALVVAALAYGQFRLSQYSKIATPGPKIAVVQENIPQVLKDNRDKFAGYFASHLKLTRDAIDTHHPEMVAWPETMVPYPINTANLDGAMDIKRRIAAGLTVDPTLVQLAEKVLSANDTLKTVATEKDVYLLVGNGAEDYDSAAKSFILQNTAVLFAPQRGSVATYAKVHLVPFGEYIPFAGKGTWLRQMLQKLTPLDYDYSLEPGKEATRFTMTTTDGNKYVFCTPICFEDTMPGPAREMTAPLPDGKKRVDFLVNISNDGWFFVAELDQHLQACQLRAVENRVPIARSVNTGNSGFIDSCGRLVEVIPPRTVGFAAWTMQLDSRVTLFARLGNVLPIVCGIVAVLLTGWTFVRPRRGKKAA